jgi:hypothetical protein
MYGITAEVVRGYACWFVHTWDYYAVQQADGSYRPSSSRLSLSRLADHLRGRYTLGTYVLDASGSCTFAVFDADSDDGLERLVLLAGELAAQGMASVLEASRRGGHLWVFLREPTPGRLVRAWLLPSALAYEVELYPKQDGLRAGGVGSLVRLPLGVHRQSGGWYPFLHVGQDGLLWPVGETVADCCAWLCASASRVAVPAGVTDGQEDDLSEHTVLAGGMGEPVGRGVIRHWCRSQDILAVIGSYTRLDARGVGRCPLPGHHYRGDVHPSLQVFAGSEPHWYCYTWQRAGDVFDFLRFYHGWTIQEAWQRLRQGTLL